MASQYGYATVASLELFASEDYGLIDATFLTDAHVEAKITAAEQMINTYLGQTFTAPIPDGVVVSTHIITVRIIYKWMREKGMKIDKEKVLESKKKLLSEDVLELLDKYKSVNVTPIKLHHMYNNDPGVFF